MSNPFDAIGNAEVYKSGKYPVPGSYPVIWIEALKMIKNKDQHDMFIAELHIIDSHVAERAAGSEMSWAANLTKHPKSAPGNVRAFLAAAAGEDPENITAEIAQAATSDDNPFHGRLIRLDAHNTKTKADKDFTACNWESLPDEYQEKAKQLHKEAGFLSAA